MITSSPIFYSDVNIEDNDSDGDKDVPVISRSPYRVIVFLNDGSLNFVVQPIITSDLAYSESLFSVEIDGDGHIDLMSASKNDDNVEWFIHLSCKSDRGFLISL